MIDYRRDEVARTLREARESSRLAARWLAAAIALTVAAGAAMAHGSVLVAVVLAIWAMPALWRVAVWRRAAEDDVDIAKWMSA